MGVFIGSKWVKTMIFSKKKWYKNSFLRDTNSDQPTLIYHEYHIILCYYINTCRSNNQYQQKYQYHEYLMIIWYYFNTCRSNNHSINVINIIKLFPIHLSISNSCQYTCRYRYKRYKYSFWCIRKANSQQKTLGSF